MMQLAVPSMSRDVAKVVPVNTDGLRRAGLFLDDSLCGFDIVGSWNCSLAPRIYD